MSVLSFPRLYFQGYLSWDPNVSNNTTIVWDPVGVNVVFPRGVDASNYQQFIIDNADGKLGDWNIYGTHACDFVQYQSFITTITGGDAGQGLVTSSDGVLGKPLSMPGRLVDLDPRGSDTSQYFFDQFMIGDESAPLVSAPRASRMHSRWINFQRNLAQNDPRIQIAGVAGALWQTAFPAASVQLNDNGSPLLGAFVKAFQQPGVLGIMVRFNVYRTLYFQNGVFNDIPQTPQTMADAQALYQQGLMFSNPAYSVVTGTVGLWMENDVPSSPGGRFLVPNANAPLGPVVAEVNAANLLSLDFGSAIPETNFDLHKQSFGTLTVTSGGTTIGTIAENQYGKKAYESTGGIIDLTVANGASLAGPIAISGTFNGQPITMYSESEYYAQTDTKNMYLDEAGQLTVTVYVSLMGDVAAPGTLVQVAQYSSTESGPLLLSPLTVGADGLASFNVSAAQPGYQYYRFQPYPAGSTPPPPPSSIDPTSDFYCGVRTLPFDDALNKNTPDSALTWVFVYSNILQPFNLCEAAAMLAIGIPLNSQSIWDTPQMAAQIAARTAAPFVENTGYMPVTRDLSNGLRQLLHRWAALVVAGKEPPSAAVATPLVRRPRRRMSREAH